MLDLAAFRRAYAPFLEGGRILLTGHSHQAWPDVARAAQAAYFDDAARFVDDKWERAIFPKLERVARRVLVRMGFREDDPLAFGKSTHELVFRLFTCLQLAERPRIVTTTSEFHSMHRQLARLAEEGVEVVWVDASDRATLAERVVAAIDGRTKMVAFSAVLFEDAFVVRDLGAIAARAKEVGAIALVDAYHAFNVVPLDLGPAKDDVFVTAGGYKYAQFGEGLCFLRAPRGAKLRPVYTGWYADFAALERPRSTTVGYADDGARFSGATFDASAAYRADAVLDHFDRFGLDVAALRAISLRQTSRIVARLDERGVTKAFPVVSSRDPDRRGGFVTVRVPDAHRVVAALREKNVFVDARADLLRLGPAPYLLDEEIDAGVDALRAVLLLPRRRRGRGREARKARRQRRQPGRKRRRESRRKRRREAGRNREGKLLPRRRLLGRRLLGRRLLRRRIALLRGRVALLRRIALLRRVTLLRRIALLRRVALGRRVLGRRVVARAASDDHERRHDDREDQGEGGTHGAREHLTPLRLDFPQTRGAARRGREARSGGRRIDGRQKT